LKLLDARDVNFDDGRSFELDIFVPRAARPVHAIARAARAIGDLEAFELFGMNAADRLTLAEHLDELVAHRRPRISAGERSSRPSSPPVSWRNFVLSLQKPPARGAAETRRF
jgi:hypothetical protein